MAPLMQWSFGSLSIFMLLSVVNGTRAIGVEKPKVYPVLLDNLSIAQFAPTLPHFLTNNPLPHGFPWGAATADSSDSYGNSPNTGVTRYYDWVISRGFNTADGYNKSVILINNQFPGPLLEANWGDAIHVKVTNKIEAPEEGLSLHWHGQPQRQTPWYDGVPSVSQCPVAPASTFTYAFRAEAYGTSWYHSHVSAQYIDGVFGPMIIYGPTTEPYDIDLGPILLSDYYHTPYLQLIGDIYEKPPLFVLSDDNLINGKTNLDCSLTTNASLCTEGTGYAKFQFTTGKTHRLRLINAGGTSTQKFSIDNHEMTVIANDYVPIQPYTTQVITLGVGQRSDVLVTATGNANDTVWMRSVLDKSCFPATINQDTALAAIYYPEAATTQRPTSNGTAFSPGQCSNDPLSQTVPLFPIKPPPAPAVTQTLDITAAVNDTGFLEFFVNNSSFHANYNNPLLLIANKGNTSYPTHPEWNVYDFGKSTSIRVIIRNFFPIVHPMHLHGHSFWVLAEGFGDWNGTVTNPQNPQRRDTQLMAPATDLPSFVVLEWNADNPGVWPLHCHSFVHVSAGLLVNVLERPDLIPSYRVPSAVKQTCRDWNRFSGAHVVDQIDSGL